MFQIKSSNNFLIFVIFSLFFILGLTHEIQSQETELSASKNILINTNQNPLFLFKIFAEKWQIISLKIKQNGADVKVKLLNPQGLVVAESDYPFSEQETEIIFAIANETGKYRLEITSKFPENGSFEIKLDELRKASSDDLKRAEAEKLFSQAQTLRTTGVTSDRIRAIEVFEKSLIIWREIGDKIGELRTLANLSYLNRLTYNIRKSEEIAKKILEFPDLREYNFYKSDALYQLGQIQIDKHNYVDAIKIQKQALNQFSEPSPQQSLIYNILGYCYQLIAEFETAESFFNQALQNANQFPDIYHQAQIRHTFGGFYNSLWDIDSAITNFKIAAELREKYGYRKGQAISLSLLAVMYFNKKKYQESIAVLEKALPLTREVGDTKTQSDILTFLAMNYRETGKELKSIELLNQALALFPDPIAPELKSIYFSMAITLTQTSDFVEARNYFEKALLGYRKNGDIDGETRTLYQFAKLERATNNLEAAKLKLENALKNHEYIQAKYNNPAQLSHLLEIRRGYFDLYIDVLMRLDKERPNQGFAMKALQISESARMRTLIWQLREALKQTPQSVDFQLLTQIQKIQQQIGEQLSLLAKAQSSPNKTSNIAEIEKAIFELNKQDESLKAQLRLSNPNIANLAQPPTLSLEQMQAELNDDTALIEYSLGDQRSYLWIVTKNSFQSFVLPKRLEIDSQARSFYDTLNQSVETSQNRPIDKKSKTNKIPASNFKEKAEKLSHLIQIKNLENLSVKRLVFVTDGALNLIPFSSLNLSQNSSIAIADKFETLQLPSLTTLHIIRQQNTKSFSATSLAIIADPVFAFNDERLAKTKKPKNKQSQIDKDLAGTLRDFSLTTIPRLPFSRIEAENIAKNSPNQSSLNLDFRASRSRLLNGEFDNYDILHFATHGFLNNQHPELSGLVLSLIDEKGNQQNGFLRTQDLYLLKIKPQMVVLSACQTGLGKQVENEGLIGLTRGFLANGTSRVIATLWKVDDSATAEFMSRFYRALLKENQKPSAALKTAQNELKSIQRYSHPRYWAGFVLTGEWY